MLCLLFLSRGEHKAVGLIYTVKRPMLQIRGVAPPPEMCSCSTQICKYLVYFLYLCGISETLHEDFSVSVTVCMCKYAHTHT